MESIVVGYLSALAAGRASLLAGRIGPGPAQAVDHALTELYDSLVFRAPALRQLHGGSLQSLSEAEHEVATALRDQRLRRTVQHLLDDLESNGGEALLGYEPTAGLRGVRADRHGVAVGGTVPYPAGTTVLHALRETKGLLRLSIITGVVLAVSGLVSFALHVALHPAGDPGIGLVLSWGCFFLGLILTGVGTIVHTSRR
ncbi:hypothetical protein [Kineosporia sp. NBRC 101731]|uniref:hypothetical protein n=1 Tax=Kineosporia sp. NBRC 101731 TaxID=3032199 RepID=UPI00255787E0|nr:hypothetical protein [Kineosporia sp. NBRC 101731]